ncbi:MAG: SRPBCC family protein [Gemmatimonadaceae bacterium]
MRIALIALVTLVALVGGVALWGSRLPVAHVARRVIHLNRPPADVWAAITDFQGQRAWRSDLKSVERVPGKEKETWKEVTSQGEMPLETTEVDPPRRLVRTIADPTLPYGGRWVYELEPDGTGSRLTITEEGEVYNPIFRFLSHYVFDQAGTIEGLMTALAAHFNEPPRITAS